MEALLVVAVLVLATVLIMGRGRRKRPAPPARRPLTLHQAVRRGDRAATARLLAEGSDVNATDRAGDTVLHQAYYNGRDGLIGSLLDRGADPARRNHAGLTPERMRDLAPVVRLMRTAADTVGVVGLAGRDQLRRAPEDLYAAALWRLVASDPAKHRAVTLAVRLGVPGTEPVLSRLLQSFGDLTMAVILLNCGSPELRTAAELWARAHGYTLIRAYGGQPATWGEF
ncbi:ankyrin repeat domain-containing protein [Actinoplanes sp. NPDC049265]|uniref:ankyrin repeat domain-containing protein n=1 Tax=Actinoplanes sp. NPDC049265 TaxID=3363902 RepID=UPI0037103FEE